MEFRDKDAGESSSKAAHRSSAENVELIRTMADKETSRCVDMTSYESVENNIMESTMMGKAAIMVF